MLPPLACALRARHLMFPATAPGIGPVTERTTAVMPTATLTKPRHRLTANAALLIMEHFHLRQLIICVLQEQHLMSLVTAPGTGPAMARTEAATPTAMPTKPSRRTTASVARLTEGRFTALQRIIYVLRARHLMSRATVRGLGPAMARTEAATPTAMPTKPSRRTTASVARLTEGRFTALRHTTFVLSEPPAMSPVTALGTGPAMARTEAAMLTAALIRPSSINITAIQQLTPVRTNR